MYTFQEATQQAYERVGPEAQALGRISSEVGAGFVLEPSFEEAFYASNNLPEQILRLFRGINARRLDEDALEQACQQTQERVRGASLLDNAVQKLLLALRNARLLERDVLVRRELTALESPALEHCVPRGPGNEALFALKKLWAQDWSFEAALERLDRTGHCALEARPVLFVAGRRPEWNPERARALGVRGVLEWEGRVVGVLE